MREVAPRTQWEVRAQEAAGLKWVSCGENDAEVLGAVMSNFHGVRFPQQCYNPHLLLRKGRPILEMLGGVKDGGASMDRVSMHSEQDSKAREELEFRERERERMTNSMKMEAFIPSGVLRNTGEGAGPPAVQSFMDSTNIY